MRQVHEYYAHIVICCQPFSATGNVYSPPSSVLLQESMIFLSILNTLDELVTCSVPLESTSPTPEPKYEHSVF